MCHCHETPRHGINVIIVLVTALLWPQIRCWDVPKGQEKVEETEATDVVEYKRGNPCCRGARDIPRSEEFEQLAASRGNMRLSFEPVQKTNRDLCSRLEARSLWLWPQRKGERGLHARLQRELSRKRSLPLREEKGKNLTRDYYVCSLLGLRFRSSLLQRSKNP